MDAHAHAWQRKPWIRKPKADKDVAAAERMAKVLGVDRRVIMFKAAAAAKGAGFCTGAKCRVEEIKEWALKRGRSMKGRLGAFAKALVGEANDPRAAVTVLAAALGTSRGALLKAARNAARNAGFCASAQTCTVLELSHWAYAKGQKLPGRSPLRAIAKLIVLEPKVATREHTPLKADKDITAAAEETAKEDDADPKELMAMAAGRAEAAGFCTGATCRAEEIKAWARRKGCSMGGSVGIFANALLQAISQVNFARCMHMCENMCSHMHTWAYGCICVCVAEEAERKGTAQEAKVVQTSCVGGRRGRKG